jgi:hypothetical protein
MHFEINKKTSLTLRPTKAHLPKPSSRAPWLLSQPPPPLSLPSLVSLPSPLSSSHGRRRAARLLPPLAFILWLSPLLGFRPLCLPIFSVVVRTGCLPAPVFSMAAPFFAPGGQARPYNLASLDLLRASGCCFLYMLRRSRA